MARRLPAALRARDILESRFKSTVYGWFEGVWSTILPVQQVGHRDFSDTERPSWGVYSFVADNGATYSTSSLTSRVDIAIESLTLSFYDRFGVPEANSFVLLTPPLSWNPFDIASTLYVPGIRPRLDFDVGNTLCLTGWNAAAPPIAGFYGIAELSQGNNAANTRVDWDPPLILPATMFMTCAVNVLRKQLIASWRYREIG